MTMASLQDNSYKENLTTCSNCFETFKNPKYFPCLHSFCEECMKVYITVTFEKSKGGVHCPMCRMFVRIPDGISVEEWSEKLPTNHVLASLIDMNKSKLGHRLCKACARENESESASSWCINCAESLCKSCIRYHRRNKFTSNHKLVDIESSYTPDVPLQRAEVMCTEHPDEKLTAYCSDHSKVCCMTCVILKHRKCDNVTSVEDSADQKKISEEIKKFPDVLNKVKKSIETMVHDTAENLQNFEKDTEIIKSAVEEMYTKLFDRLRRMKSDILSEISKMEKEVRPEIQDKHNELKRRLSTIESDLVLFQTNMRYAPPAQFLQSMEKLMEKRFIHEEFAENERKKLKEMRITFEANKKLLEQHEDTAVLGKIRRQFMSSISVPLLNEVNGIAVLESGQILLSSFQSRTIELRDPNCSNVLSSLSLERSPFAIKMTSKEEGAVLVQNLGLVTFKVQYNQLKKLKEIETNAMHDFVYHQRKFYLGYHKKIIVIDPFHNKKVREISVNNHVDYMDVRDDTSLCYTEYGGRKLYCISMEGMQKFRYSHDNLRHTTGVTVDQTGHIYVCGHNSNNIHLLSHEGELQKIILNNLPPRLFCVSLNKSGDKAVIGCGDKVLLYDLK